MRHLDPPVAARVGSLAPNFFGAMDRRIAERSREPGPPVINLSKGNPDQPTPAHIIEAMQRGVADPRNHGYPSYSPRPALSRAIAERYRIDHGVRIDPEHEVAIFHGSHEAFMAAVLACADPGTAVVLPDPGYPLYESAVSLAGAVPVALPLIEPDYQPDPTALEALGPASVLLLNYPHNPTGATARAGTLEAASATAARIGAALVHDFAYSSLGFDGERPRSALAVDGEAQTVEVSTVSKTYNMAGWRFGFAAGSAAVIAAMRRYQSHAFSTVFGATQEAATAALAGDQTLAADLVGLYERRRDLFVEGLRQLGWNVVAPRGTFFVWLRVPDGDDVGFAGRLLDEAAVAVAAGSGFGSRGRGHVRLALVVGDDSLREVLARLAALGAPGT